MNRWALAALALAAAPVTMVAAQDWNLTFTQTERGHSVGNPDAQVHIIEFVSYTCPHCAHFEAESDAAMRLQYLHGGTAQVEVRSYLRNPIDIAATLVAECGDPDDFFANHRALMLGQERWMENARNATEAQMARWQAGPISSRMRAIGDDMGFHELMESRGLSRVEVDRCLSDEGKVQQMIADHEANNADFEILGTPSFAINGALLDNVHSWGQLQPAIESAATLESSGQ